MAIAGATFHAIMSKGKFQGTTWATTPTGSCSVYAWKDPFETWIVRPKTLSAYPAMYLIDAVKKISEVLSSQIRSSAYL